MPSDTRLLSKPGLLVAFAFIAFVYFVQKQQQQPPGNEGGSSSSSSSAFFFPFPFYVLFAGTIVGTGVVASSRRSSSQESTLP